jgi:cell division septation protein DedD
MICSNCRSEVPIGYRFCLQCGSSISEPPPTVRWDAHLKDTTATNRTTTGHSLPQTGAPAWRLLLYMVCGALSIFGGLVLYNMYQGKSSNQEAKQVTPDAVRNDNSIGTMTQDRAEKPQPSVPPIQKTSPGPSYSSSTASSASGEKIWYVMLGGYKEPNWDRAELRLNYFQQQGYKAYIVETNDYQNFDPELHAIVMGPYTKNEAESMASQLRPLQPDVYI